MKKINRTYLKKKTTTDVLSFQLSDAEANYLDAEVYVNIDKAKKQAKEYGVTIKNELLRLTVHGILHLFGYSDKTKKQRKIMTEKEDFYIEKI